MEEKDLDINLKFRALDSAVTLHCSLVANSIGAEKIKYERKPVDVIDTAKQIYEWLKI